MLQLTLFGSARTFELIERTDSKQTFIDTTAASKAVAMRLVFSDQQPDSATGKKGGRRIKFIRPQVSAEDEAVATGPVRVIEFYYELFAEDSFTALPLGFSSALNAVNTVTDMDLDAWIQVGADIPLDYVAP